MANNIKLIIYMPEKRVLEKQVYRVVLPCNDKTLTVIEDRAPTLLPLNMGIIKILDEDNHVTEEYFIADGAVDIKENTCTILTESALNRRDVTLDYAHELYDEFPNPFYQWLVEFMEKETKK